MIHFRIIGDPGWDDSVSAVHGGAHWHPLRATLAGSGPARGYGSTCSWRLSATRAAVSWPRFGTSGVVQLQPADMARRLGPRPEPAWTGRTAGLRGTSVRRTACIGRPIAGPRHRIVT